MRRYASLLAVAPAPRAQQQHGRQADPAAHRMHHHGTREIVEFAAEGRLQPGLDAVVVIPGDALEEGINETDQQEGRTQHGVEARALGHAAGDDGRNGGSEGEQEEELHQFVAVLLGERFRTAEKGDAVGDGIADEEIGHRGNGKIGHDFHQRVHLVFLAHRAQLKERKPGVHCQHHDRAQQDEQGIAACFQFFHVLPPLLLSIPNLAKLPPAKPGLIW